MNGIFGTMWIDLGFAALFGALGGLGLGLLQEKGLEWPRRYQHHYKDGIVNFTKLGFIADICIGALAGIIIYALNPPSGATQLVASTVTAGLGGSAILKGYINGKVASERATLMEGYKGTTHMAMKGGDMGEVQKRMLELEHMEQEITRRWPEGM